MQYFILHLWWFFFFFGYDISSPFSLYGNEKHIYIFQICFMSKDNHMTWKNMIISYDIYEWTVLLYPWLDLISSLKWIIFCFLKCVCVKKLPGSSLLFLVFLLFSEIKRDSCWILKSTESTASIYRAKNWKQNLNKLFNLTYMVENTERVCHLVSSKNRSVV